MKTFQKQPREELDYDIDLIPWLENDDVILRHRIIIPEGMAVSRSLVRDNRLRIWISGGEDGEAYKFSILFYTVQGRIKEVDFLIVVVDL